MSNTEELLKKYGAIRCHSFWRAYDSHLFPEISRNITDIIAKMGPEYYQANPLPGALLSRLKPAFFSCMDHYDVLLRPENRKNFILVVDSILVVIHDLLTNSLESRNFAYLCDDKGNLIEYIVVHDEKNSTYTVKRVLHKREVKEYLGFMKSILEQLSNEDSKRALQEEIERVERGDKETEYVKIYNY